MNLYTSNTITRLTQLDTTTLTINGAMTINQPTSNNIRIGWNIHGGTATVSGLITFAGASATASRISSMTITTGQLNANGGITFTGSASATNKIIMSGGTSELNLKGALTIPANSCTLTAGSSGSIFNFADTSAAQTINFFTRVLTTISISTIPVPVEQRSVPSRPLQTRPESLESKAEPLKTEGSLLPEERVILLKSRMGRYLRCQEYRLIQRASPPSLTVPTARPLSPNNHSPHYLNCNLWESRAQTGRNSYPKFCRWKLFYPRRSNPW